MYVVGVEAEIGGKRFERVHSVEVEESTKQLGKRATLKIPTTARLERQGDFVSEVEVAKTFQTGDEVVISFGYDDDVRERFRGFVRKITPGIPLTVECEDRSYLLRRKRLQKAFRNVTLEALLNFILEDSGIVIANPDTLPVINFKKFSFRNINGAQALEELRKKYGLTIYFRSYDQLVVGIASETDGKVVKFVTGCNVIEHGLEWEDEQDVQLKVKAISVSNDNVFTTAEAGDPNGAQRTIYFYDLELGEDLAARALEELRKYRYSGYRGSLTAFLIPEARIGNTARFQDANFDNREGDYLVEEVKTMISSAGGRQRIKIGLKLD